MEGWTPAPDVATPAPRMQPLGTLTTLAVTATIVALSMQVLQLVLFGTTGRFVSMTTDNVQEAVQFLGITMLAGLIGVLQIVAGLVWFYRASMNVTLRGFRDRKWGPGWAVGAWFIPLANAILGFFAIFEIWRGSQREATADNWHDVGIPGWIRLWWGTYITYTAVNIGYAVYAMIVSFRTVFEATRAGVDPEPVTPYLPLQIAMFAIYALAGVFYIRFMFAVRDLQDRPESMPATPF